MPALVLCISASDQLFGAAARRFWTRSDMRPE